MLLPDPEHLTKLFGMEVLMMKIGADQKNCICQKGRSRRVGQTGCRGIIGIKTEQGAEHAICFVAVLVIKVKGLQIGKKLSEPGRADRGTDGRGRGKGGLIEQRGSFFSGKFHPGIIPWIPGQDNSESYHKDKSESFRRCERGKFFYDIR